MKKLSIILLLFNPAAYAVTTTQVVVPGLVYQKITQAVPPLVIHMLTANPSIIFFKPVHATNNGNNVESVLSMSQRQNAIAAINGAFYRAGGRFNGNSIRLSRNGINTFYTDTFYVPGTLIWDPNPNLPLIIDRVISTWQLTINGINYPISTVNQPRGTNQQVVYTTAFCSTTLTDTGGKEIVVTNGVVTSNIPTTTSNSTIPGGANSFVYSLGPASTVNVTNVFAGQLATLTKTFVRQSNPNSQPLADTFFMAGVPLIVQNGQVVTTAAMNAEMTSGAPIILTADERVPDFNNATFRDQFINQPAPRTAVGLTANGTWVFVVVEGSQPLVSVGMTLPQLAIFMQSVGCINAVNLSGGGDSTLVINGKLINVPTGTLIPGPNEEQPFPIRPVADCICIFNSNNNINAATT